jgi:5-formyltetrahydrofolate cyclo-ligase
VNLDESKKQARLVQGKIRSGLHAELKDQAPMALAEIGLGFAGQKPPQVVSGFYPFRSEISTLPLLARLRDEGFTTALPIVLGPGQPLLFRQWADTDAMGKGEWDIPVPLDSAREVLPDILFVPLLAFDRKGYRLGYGGGFYDRTLAKLRAVKSVIAIGTAYAGQEVDMVPRGEFDAPLDWVLTEKGPILCG